MAVYDDDFYKSNRQTSYGGAKIMLDHIMDRLCVHSAVDFGCGAGGWLKRAQELGCQEIVGVDGAYVNQDLLLIDKGLFIARDLSSEISLGRKFDLAISLEVAEHIDERCADAYVGNLCRHSDVVLFSAAPEGQGGKNHVNEKPLSYWADKFGARGFKLLDCLRGVFWNQKELALWYRQNIVFFIREDIFDSVSSGFPKGEAPVDIVHPELFKSVLEAKEKAEKHLISRAWVRKHFPGVYALIKRLWKR
jgi:hypothetical protein